MYDGHLTRLLFDGTVDHRNGQQFVNGKGFAGDGFERVHRIEPHGLATWPVEGGIGAAMQARGARDSFYVFGGENPKLRPAGDYLTMGGAVLYDHTGNVVSVVAQKLRIVHATAIHLVAPQIILEGNVLLGGPDADKPASMEGTIDSAGHVETSGFASKVKMK